MLLVEKNYAGGYVSATVKILGDNLKRLRKERNMQANELAELLGVTPPVVSRWETQRGLPETTTLLRLAKALEVSVDQLLDGIDEGYDLIRHAGTRVPSGDDVDGDEREDVSGYQKFSIPVIAEGDASPEGLFWSDEGVKLIEAEEWMSRPNDAAVKDPRCYGVKVRGDSMEPLLEAGMRVIVSPNLPVTNKGLGYVQLRSGERLIKMVHVQPGGYTLESFNRAYAPRFVTREEVGAVHRIAYIRTLK